MPAAQCLPQELNALFQDLCTQQLLFTHSSFLQQQQQQQQQQRKWLSPTDLVAAKLMEAAAAASAAAGTPFAEAANNLYAGFASSLPLANSGVCACVCVRESE
jgi:hypothetical protein